MMPGTGIRSCLEYNSFMKRILLYFFAAFVAMLVNVVSRFLLTKIIPFAVSVFIAYWIGHIINFLLSNTLVFEGKDKRNTKTTFIKFTLVACAGLGVTFVVSLLANYFLEVYFSNYNRELRETISHLAGIGCSFVFNYIGHIFFSFKNL